MIWRLVYFAICALVVAGIVHIAIVLLIPRYGTQDAYDVVSARTDEWSFTTLDSPDERSPLSDIDPFFSYGVCRFDLSESGVWIKGDDFNAFWSATVLNSDGTVAYSLNRRTSIDGKLDLVLFDPVLILRLREAQPAEIERSIVIEADMRKGFVVVRSLKPDASWDSETGKFMQSISCERYLPEPAAPEPAEEEQPAS